MIAEVNSEVVADPVGVATNKKIPLETLYSKDSPPISAVLTLPPLMTSKVELAMLFAMESRPRCLSIIVALRIIAAGFARLVPMISFAT